ncbi:phage holin family protein [Pseudomonas monteilii]|uniref:phage holin family protein n=1 Tax=Pseudomonas monteilii TaxID=76759 RepID=UPI0018A95955|nr:phage holin family protein [Pseudomonas monteilii]MBF8746885.1 phage holin family protein [Pseudomonas monteilii]
MKDDTGIYAAIGHWAQSFGEWAQSFAPEAMLSTRALCHFAIFLVIAGYRKKTDHHRRIVGLMAGLLAGANLAEAYRITVNFSSFAALTQYPLTVVMIGFLFFVIYSRGNVAKLIPPRLNRILR